MLSEKIKKMYPGLGFFGASPLLMLRVQVDAVIFGIRLSLQSTQPTFLNLQRLELYRSEDRLSISDLPEYIETLSTCHEAVVLPPALLKGTGIHSASEVAPWWQVVFDSGLKVDELRIANRRDTWGRRACGLNVEILDEAGNWHLLYFNSGEMSFIKNTISLAQDGYLKKIVSMHEDFSLLRLQAINAAAKKLVDLPESVLIYQDWNSLLALMDLWQTDFVPLSDEELTIVAAFVYAQLKQRDDFSFSYFSSRLYSSSQIDRLADRVSKIYAKPNESFMFTRHGLQKQGKLISRKEAFTEAAQKVVALLEQYNFQPILAYGTLLGAVRDNGFIAHDDDLDLLCRIDAYDFDSARQVMRSLIELFKRSDFNVNFSSENSLNLHIQDKSNGALIDLFPYWVNNGSIFLHMENMKIRGIPEHVLSTRSTINLYGTDFPVPIEYKSFLEERYGINWCTPMRYFEWPWSLVRE